jgi:HD-like signal output (HDOD) protein
MAFSEEVQFILNAAEDLPPLPETLIQVLQLSADKDASIQHLAKLISHDPALTSRILKTANSAFYKPIDEIKSIEAATSRLGINSIRNILLTLSLMDTFPEIYGDYYTSVFHSSLYTALAAESIAGGLRPAVKADAFFTGILHNVGKLLFLRYLEKKYVAIISTAQKYGIDIRTVEKATLGIDFIQAGSVIAKRWKLPKIVTDMFKNYDFPDSNKNDNIDENQAGLIQAIRCAHHAAEFYTSWNKYQRLGSYQHEMKKFFNIDGADSLSQLEYLPKQFFDVSGTLGIKIQEADTFKATFDKALEEIPGIHSKTQKIFAKFIEASSFMKK